MYGFFNQCIEQLVVRQFGQEQWLAILYVRFSRAHVLHLTWTISTMCHHFPNRKEAKVEVKSFTMRAVYPDNITFDLTNAAATMLKMPKSNFLELLGRFYIDYTIECGYKHFLDALGATLRDFFQNIDVLHDHLQQIFPDMRPPSFRCTPVNKTDTILHYYSSQPSADFEHLVIGQIQNLAKIVYNTSVTINVQENNDNSTFLDSHHHIQFLIREVDSNNELHTTSKETDDVGTDDGGGVYPTMDKPLVSQDLLCETLPFHFVFDSSMKIKQAGDVLARILPQLLAAENDTMLSSIFTLQRPRIPFTFAETQKHINALFVIQVAGEHIQRSAATFVQQKHQQQQANTIDILISEHTGGSERAQQTPQPKLSNPNITAKRLNQKPLSPLRLRGQMIQISDSLIMFCGTPSVSNMDELRDTSLFLQDLPAHDATRDIILSSDDAFRHEHAQTRELEKMTEILHAGYEALQSESRKVDRLLYDILPLPYANELKRGNTPQPQRFEMASLLVCGVTGFKKYCAEQQKVHADGAANVIGFINNMLQAFDTVLCDRARGYCGVVHRVQTVQDHTLFVSGLPVAHGAHARAICRYALDLMELTTIPWPSLHNGESLYLTTAIHAGEVVAGFTALVPKRFSVFGNAVNVVHRVWAAGTPDYCNASQEMYNLMQQSANADASMVFEYRDSVKIKGRPGPMKMYHLSKHGSSNKSKTDAFNS